MSAELYNAKVLIGGELTSDQAQQLIKWLRTNYYLSMDTGLNPLDSLLTEDGKYLKIEGEDLPWGEIGIEPLLTKLNIDFDHIIYEEDTITKNFHRNGLTTTKETDYSGNLVKMDTRKISSFSSIEEVKDYIDAARHEPPLSKVSYPAMPAFNNPVFKLNLIYDQDTILGYGVPLINSYGVILINLNGTKYLFYNNKCIYKEES